MRMRKSQLIVSAFAAWACVVLLPGAVQAQSAIAGVVKDPSGAVLPGVSVEASSDVLIEKARAVTTDGQGQYKIVDLRPGLYVVTFALAGFQTVKRQNVDLPGEFTATINAERRSVRLKSR
jgi:carboxypeptidase family protein